MEVNIEVKEIATPTRKTTTSYSKFWGIPKASTVEGDPIATWEVHLTLLPSEVERAAIFKYKLADLIVEQEPIYTQQQIDEVYELYRGADTGEYKNRYQRMWEERKEAKTVYRIQNYFDNPYVRIFGHPQDAYKYVDKLKAEVLPLIKENIDHFGARSNKESFTL